MKKFKLIFPKSKADEFAEYAYANEIRIMLSWLQEGDFFSLSSAGNLHCVCISSEEKATALMASDWKQYVQK